MLVQYLRYSTGLRKTIFASTSQRFRLQSIFSTKVSVDDPLTSQTPIFSEFSKLGLLSNIVDGLSNQSFTQPTPVQKAVIPRLIAGESIVMAASTGKSAAMDEQVIKK